MPIDAFGAWPGDAFRAAYLNFACPKSFAGPGTHSLKRGNGHTLKKMIKIILADNQAIFRAGTAKILAIEDDFRVIAQCADSDRMYQAIDAFPGGLPDVLCQ